MPDRANEFAEELLNWYDVHRRDLPWRVGPDARQEPYKIWLSEIMLQQTTVTAVISYYSKFLTRWPTVTKLAAASLDDVLHAWQGLGYYARARNLHKCAQVVVTKYGGHFPDNEAELMRLPGIGSYTAAAMSAIAFGKKATPIDANIERVISRVYAIEEPLPRSKKLVRTYAENLTPSRRYGDFAQALMDLGATICRPRLANCGFCPVSEHCRAFGGDDPVRYPIKPAKLKRPNRYGVVFWIERSDGRVMVCRRPDEGLLGGMTVFPTTEWCEQNWELESWVSNAPLEGKWIELVDPVIHVFTHFRLELRIKFTKTVAGDGGSWCHPNDFGQLALPTVMKKVARAVTEFQVS